MLLGLAAFLQELLKVIQEIELQQDASKELLPSPENQTLRPKEQAPTCTLLLSEFDSKHSPGKRLFKSVRGGLKKLETVKMMFLISKG